MRRPKHNIGIDIGSETHAVSIYKKSDHQATLEIQNNPEGFSHLLEWFDQQGVEITQSIICVEATGVYGEALCYFLYAHGYKVAIEAPHKVKRAFDKEDKTNIDDAQQIAEYAYRYFDKLKLWEPNDPRVEEIRILLSTRERLTKDQAAYPNMLHAFGRKTVQNKTSEKMLKKNIAHFKKQIKAIEQEIDEIFKQDPGLAQRVSHLDNIPAVGLLLISNLFVFTNGLPLHLSSTHLAANLGIAPRLYQSGTSVYRKPRSRQQGHKRIRKLLRLAA